MRYIFHILALASLALALVGCSTGDAHQTTSTTTPAIATSTPVPTQPSIASGTVLYQSNWAQGLAPLGNPAGWKIVDGMPQSDLSEKNALTLPLLSAASDYALEVRFQIVSVPKDGGYFVVTSDRLPNKDGYNAGILNLLGPAAHNQFANPQVQVYIEPTDDMDRTMQTSDFEPDPGWLTYRIEVRGSSVKFLVNGVGKSSATSTKTDQLSNGPLRVISSSAVVRVASISLTAL